MITNYKDFLDKLITEKYEDIPKYTSSSDNEFKTIQLENTEEMETFLKRFWVGKEWITKEGDFDVFLWDYKDYDDSEQEYYWHKKEVILVDWKNFIIKSKEIHSEPLLSVRDKELTINQEIKVRWWCGTLKHPKKGKYIGVEDGIAMIRSGDSGNIIKIDKEGNYLD